ncbi:MAG: decaprenyl-phosphate phosphoribosyltransferase [Chlamydiales bacterium]|nr:decaprenyl-phosphate phosphoribosyltransferase [Chlamydiales bacterium]
MSSLSYVRQLIRLMRPFQWWKNGFVFVGLFFGHAWTQPHILWSSLLCAFAFCLVSSGVYVINDIMDVEADRNHPKKRLRPIAAGTVSVQAASILAAILWTVGFAAAWMVSWTALIIIAIYCLMNFAYSIRLKHVVIVDAFVIATGFILRVLAGTLGIGIPPSQWLLLCTIMVTLFLAFTKRRAEAIVMAETNETGRKVLSHYTPELLDSLIGITAACTILSYSLYATNPETIRIHHTPNLIATVPLVTYGIFRYMYLLHKWHAGENPAKELLGDKHMVATAVTWILLTIWLIS